MVEKEYSPYTILWKPPFCISLCGKRVLSLYDLLETDFIHVTIGCWFAAFKTENDKFYILLKNSNFP